MASIITQKGSSSSSTQHWKYEVFLSFRGEDTRTNFADHLYFALIQKGIVTFKNDEYIEGGKSISPEILKAIEHSRFSIVILSRNYASSTWCLEELAKIVECMKEIGTTVMPIFYDVDPSDVRKQTGCFAYSFAAHEENFKNHKERVQSWRATLKEVANLKGWHLQDGSQSKFVQIIARYLWHKLRYAFFEDTKDLVGIDSRVKELESRLAIEVNDVRMIGVWGMGGIGKTTLAKVVYDMVLKKFEGCCFLANVREVCEKDGLVPLQQQLIRQILNESMSILDADEGVFNIKNILHHKRILLVLDDVSQLDQLKKLAGKHGWFGSGSRVIITTRDKHLLQMSKVDEIYKVQGLNDDEALHLLCLKAFKIDHPPKDYLELSKDVVKYAKGLPLTIEILGSVLFNRSINQWISTLNRLKEFPEHEILQVLKISCDGLQEVEKKLFLYIACFFNHEGINSVVEKLDYLGLYPDFGLGVLVDKSLIKVNEITVWMHEILQTMGREIIYEECPKEPGKRSCLWSFKDINDVLTKNTGSNAIQCIVLKLPESRKAYWNPESFSKMHNLKLLIINNVQLLHEPKHLPNGLRYLEWSGYPSKSLPSNFQSDELIELCMCSSYIEVLWRGAKYFKRLKIIQLNKSLKLLATPDFTGVPNLEKLAMEDCINLHEVHPSIVVLKKLTLLNLKGCKKLRAIPSKFEMESLEILILSGCAKLKRIPEFGTNMQRVMELYLDGTAITKLPTSIGHLIGLTSLILKDCKNLMCLPSSVFDLKWLKDVNISGCSKLGLENLWNAESVEELDLRGIATRGLPSSIACRGLTLSNKLRFNLPPFYSMPGSPDPMGMLELENCTSLRSLPNLPLSIATISASGCTSLKPNSLCEVEPSLSSCSKLADNQGVISIFSTVIRKHLQGLYVDSRYDIIFHGSVIPKWFGHQSVGAELNVNFPFHFCHKVIGIAVCSAFCSLPHHQIYDKCSLNCQLIVNGKEVSLALGIETIVGSSNQIWVLYLEGDLISLQECDENGFSEIGIRIETTSGLEVKKCGLHMVFKEDIEDWKESSKSDLGELVRGKDLIGQLGRLFAKEKSEEQITLEPQTVLFDVEEVDMTIHSSEETKFEIEEIGREASQTQPEGIEMMFDGEAMQPQATSTLKPQGVVFDVEAYKITKSSRQMEFQIEDIDMEPEAIEQHGSKVDQHKEARRLLMQGGLGLTEPPKDEDWENTKEIYLMNNEFSILPDNPRCPELSALFLQGNYKLRTIPHSFFDYMPALQILNLSRTSIRSLPDSLTRLVSLKRLFLNDCHCFMMLSPKVGELKQLEVLDLEGTEIMHLPEEIKKLTNLTCLEVSFYGCTSNGRRAMQSNAVVPYGVVSALSQLEELNIDVNPDDERWDACVEAILTEICNLMRLNTLKFYFPRVKLLRFLQCNSPMGIYPSLSHFRFTVGQHVKRIMFRVPRDVEFELERWEKCLKFINGVDIPRDIKKALQHATAFFLDRHATVKNLSNFGIQNMEKLKCCVMGECNEVEVIIDEAHAYEEDDDSNEIAYDSYGTEKIVLGSLEYLYVYRMKSLRSIWIGQFQWRSFFLLKSLTLYKCPKLTTIFMPSLLDKLCNLEELTVKDCPSIRSLVSCENTAEHKSSYFLPNLKRISLHYMPGLVSISGGLHIAPNLEWSSFYNCPNLKNPFTEEVSSKDLKKIKGERSWWKVLEWSNGGPGYLAEIFFPIDIWDC